MKHALVVFSGGQDSTTCLAWSLNRFERVSSITFQYGQKHIIEIEQSKKIAKQLNVTQTIIDASFFKDVIESELTKEDGNMPRTYMNCDQLPASFVPNRNGFFLTLAHGFAQKTKATHLVAGMCQTDYSGYPDCREVFIKSLQDTLNLGSSQNIKILTPLMHLTKGEIFLLAKKEKILDTVIYDSHTCYNGISNMNKWGRGCGDCDACILRKKGYQNYLSLISKD